jgi:predicted O-methyltransferase YrrM
MKPTTRIKQLLNSVLNPLGFQIDTLVKENAEGERMRRLKEMDYFSRPAFPVPNCVATSDWASCVSLLPKYRDDLSKLQNKNDNDVQFTNTNQFYHPPDSDILYALIRDLAPRKIIEIGSGNSTKLSRQAIKDGKLSTRLISIDPFPRQDIDEFADEIRRHCVEKLDPVVLANELEPGDFLFIDSSHLVAVGNDCVYEFLQLIPHLKPGVVIHVHDVSIPWDYPMEWLIDEPQVATWAEIYLLQAMLVSSDQWRVIWPGYYAQKSTDIAKWNSWFPHRNGRDARSFWFVRKG